MIIKNIDNFIAFKDYIVITNNGVLPINLSDAKAHLNEYGTDNDTYITSLLTVATELGELITGRDFINKTYKGYLDYFPNDCVRIEIRKSKLQSISSIQYYSNDILETLNPDNYLNTNNPHYSEVFLKDGYSYPLTDKRLQAVEIEFVAGYGSDANDVPAGIKQGLYMIVASLFENRGDCNDCVETLANKVLRSYILPCKTLSI